MSDVTFEFVPGDVSGADSDAQVMPVTDPRTETIVSSGTSQQTTVVARRDDICAVTNNGADAVWLQFGRNPTAAADQSHLLLANQTRFFGRMVSNAKAAVKNA